MTAAITTTDALLRLMDQRINDLERRVQLLEDVLAAERQMRRTLANRIDDMELSQ